jgi:cytochrome c556
MKSLLSSACFLVAFTLSANAIDTPMETSMKAMSKAGKQLNTDLKLTDDTKHDKATDLASVATMKISAQKSHDLVPKKEQTLPADQQAAMTADFQKDMDAFEKDVDTLNADITADKWDAARTDFQKLIDDEKAGHKKFRVEKK